MNFKVTLSLLLWLTTKVTPFYRIINGTYAVRGHFPYQALMIVLPKNISNPRVLYGGTLVTTRWVLTSATCVLSSYEIKIHLGTVVFPGNETGRVIQRSSDFVVHHLHNANRSAYDVALVRLPQKVAVTRYVSPVRLPYIFKQDEQFYGYKGVVSGFGSVRNQTDVAYSHVLQYSTLAIISNEECLKAFPFIQSAVMCTVANSSSPCDGDVGGPLVVIHPVDRSWVLVGVLSFSTDSCDGKPDVFTRVTYVMDWIRKTCNITQK